MIRVAAALLLITPIGAQAAPPSGASPPPDLSGIQAQVASALQQAQAAYAQAATAKITAEAASATASAAVKPADVASQISIATSGLASKASVPTPATIAPPAEATTGSAGTMTQNYALANHTHPRITNSQVVTTVTGGTFAGTWPAGFFATSPVVDLSWEGNTVLPITCQLTGTPTTTAFAGKCWSIAVASILALGAGTRVHVLALPAS